ncbi:membrane porin [Spirochaetota bacterium]|nr:membrane porin [Spirochaetota bacterium]
MVGNWLQVGIANCFVIGNRFLIVLGLVSFSIFLGPMKNSPGTLNSLQAQFPVPPQPSIPGNGAIEITPSEITPSASLKISLRPSARYFVRNEPVMIEVLFENTSQSGDNYRLRLWENMFEQWTFTVRHETGHMPYQTFAYKKWEYDKRENLPVAARREITLAPGETFSSSLRLDQYSALKHLGYYTIGATFYPLSVNNPDYLLPVTSTEIELREGFYSLDTLSPEQATQSTPPQNPSLLSSLPDDVANYSRLAASETIRRMLTALQFKDWRTYLSYLQIDSLIETSYRSTDYYERMLTATPLEKRVIVNEFRDFLVTATTYDPVNFEILQTLELGSEAKVDVLITTQEAYQQLKETLNPLTGQLEFNWTDLTTAAPLTRNRIFKYTLALVNNMWKVVAIDVQLFDGNISDLQSKYSFNDKEPPVIEIDMELIEKVLFSFNQFQLIESYTPRLEEIVAFLRIRPTLKLRLIGFTDDIGTESYNQNLSRQRVITVRDFFLERGIPANRIELFARGESNPLNSNRNEQERSLNRRVEIYFVR